MEGIQTKFQGLPLSGATVVLHGILRRPGNLIGPGSGLLSGQVRRVSLLHPALVYYLSYLTGTLIKMCVTHLLL